MLSRPFGEIYYLYCKTKGSMQRYIFILFSFLLFPFKILNENILESTTAPHRALWKVIKTEYFVTHFLVSLPFLWYVPRQRVWLSPREVVRVKCYIIFYTEFVREIPLNAEGVIFLFQKVLKDIILFNYKIFISFPLLSLGW